MELLNSAIAAAANEYSDFPDKEEIVGKIACSFSVLLENPPLQLFELLFRKPFTSEEVQVALFRPQEEQVAYFVVLLGIIGGRADLMKLRSTAMSLVFLIHRKTPAFKKEFMLCGGLRSLVSFLGHENLYLRGQGTETFMSLTDCDFFDWFQPASSPDDKAFHQEMLSLRHQPQFLLNVLKNRNDSYPGGSFRALQLLAFWVSWIRALYTPDHILPLSDQLLDELRQWSVAECSGRSREEKELAATLLRDFGEEQFKRCGYDPSSAERPIGLCLSGIVEPECVPPKRTLADRLPELNQLLAQPAPDESDAVSESAVTLDSVIQCKDLGNKHYRAGQHRLALEKYQLGLTHLEQLRCVIKTAEYEALLATLHTNCAVTWWKIVSEFSEDCNSATSRGDDALAACVFHCRAALHVDALNIKAIYRLGSALLLQGKASEALQQVNGSIASIAAEYRNNRAKIDENECEHCASSVDILRQLRLKCMAAIVMATNAGDNADAPVVVPREELGMPSETAGMVQAILCRSRVEQERFRSVLTLAANREPFERNDNISQEEADNDPLEEAASVNSSLLNQLVPETLNVNRLPAMKATGRTPIADPLKLVESRNASRAGKDCKAAVEKVIKKPKKAPTISAAAAKACQHLKKIASAWEGKKLDHAAALVDAEQAVACFTKEGATLAQLFTCTMEEAQCALLLALAVARANAGRLADAGRVLQELVECDRARTLLSLVTIGAEGAALKADIAQTVERCAAAAILDDVAKLRSFFCQ